MSVGTECIVVARINAVSRGRRFYVSECGSAAGSWMRMAVSYCAVTGCLPPGPTDRGISHADTDEISDVCCRRPPPPQFS